MKTTKQSKGKASSIRIDKSLNKYDDIVLFPEKLEEAKKVIQKIGVPKI